MPNSLEKLKEQTTYAETLRADGKTPRKENEIQRTKEIKEDVLEEMEIEKRRLNMIVKGVPENKSDEEEKEFVDGLLTSLIGQKGSKSLENMERIGKFNKDRKRN